MGHFGGKSLQAWHNAWARKRDYLCVVHGFSHVLTVTLHVDIENSGSPRSSCWRGGNRGAGRLLLPIMMGWTSHTHTQPYTHTWIYTQKLSVKPIPPNGHSLILLTGAQGGNEVCHLYIHDPWLTPLPHSPPPSWPGNGTLLGWDGGDRNRDWDSVWMERSDTNTSMLSTQISPQMGSKPVLSHLFWYLPPLLSLTLSHTHNC